MTLRWVGRLNGVLVMNNQINRTGEQKTLSGKFIKQNKLSGMYIAKEGYTNSVFILVPRLSNFLIVEKEDIYLSEANWDGEHFIRFEGTVELKN